MYIDENGLAEFTLKMKEYIDSKFAPEPEPEPITDLTGTTWELNSTINCDGRSYNINIEYDEYEFELLMMLILEVPDGTLYGLYFDAYMIAEGVNTNIIPTNNDIFTITGGTDTTNQNLITWLQENATQIS